MLEERAGNGVRLGKLVVRATRHSRQSIKAKRSRQHKISRRIVGFR